MVLKYRALRGNAIKIRCEYNRLVGTLQIQTESLKAMKQEKLDSLLDSFYKTLNFQAELIDKVILLPPQKSEATNIRTVFGTAERDKNKVVESILEMGENPVVEVFIKELDNKKEISLIEYKEFYCNDFIDFIFEILDTKLGGKQVGPKNINENKDLEFNRYYDDLFKSLDNKKINLSKKNLVVNKSKKQN